MIKKVLQDPAIRPENVYNMDDIGVMLRCAKRDNGQAKTAAE